MARQLPTLVTNPPSDRSFVTFAQELVAGGIDEPAELQARLRERYPEALVRPRDLTWERRVVWYVYRDGRWMSEEEASATER
jgi:hypothetical protein